MDIDWNDFAGKALEVLIVASIVIPVVRPLVARFKAFTKKTKNKLDDGIAWWAMWIVDGLAAIVGALLDVFPVVSNRRMSRPPSDDHGSGIGGIPMICLCLAFGGLTTGCAGTTPEAREARTDIADMALGTLSDGYKRLADEWMVPRYLAKGEGCRETYPTDHAAYETCMAAVTRFMLAFGSGGAVLHAARYGTEAAGGKEAALECLPWAVERIVGSVEGMTFVGSLELPEWADSILAVMRAGATAFSSGAECELED